VESFDLDRHAVIEASAGTGKTYTLEHLVRRLLLAGKASLEQILLVTFTEKAAGELKARLRANLEAALTAFPEQHGIVQTALDQFDQIHVYTIHGFCQRILQEYAFEHGQELRHELVDDGILLPVCLREIQRKTWPQEYGARLRTVLELAGYQGNSGRRWEQQILRVAGNLRRTCGERLCPEPAAGWRDHVPVLEARLRDGWARVRKLADMKDASPPERHPWYTGYAQITQRKNQKEKRQRALLGLLKLLGHPDAEERALAAFVQLLNAGEFGDGFAFLTSGLSNESAGDLRRLCPRLDEAVEVLKELRAELKLLGLPTQLIAESIVAVQEHLAAYKRERGLRSFDDMLVMMDAGLDPAVNPGSDLLVERLRGRFRYAIVDEFQDTDPLQWRIFKRIFVEGGSSRLFIVGDPKQAIFGFRGADLPTYLRAVAELKEEHGAGEHQLATNWRSAPAMLKALNRLFQEGDWFQGSLSYVPVQPPAEPRNRVTEDRSGRAALTLIDWSGSLKLSQARARHAHFVAREIRRLLGLDEGRSLLDIAIRETSRPLQASDICVLIFKRRESKALTRALRHQGIPFTFYKQGGLWQADEATQLGYLLRALARPEDAQSFHKALLTGFFRVKPEQLTRDADLPPRHAARVLFQKWVELAESRAWAVLFQSLLEDTGILHADLLQSPDGERRLANYRHIFGTLEQAAYGQNLDLLGVLEVLEQKRRQFSRDDSDLQPIETEKSKVRIMTVHASKGLEFPVVFLAGGFTGRQPRDEVTYRDNAGNLVYDLDPDDAARARYKRDADQEDRRLLYVALTRSMFKLYVPNVTVDKPQLPGPVVTILAPALAKSDVENLGQPWAERVHSSTLSEHGKKGAERRASERSTLGTPRSAPAAEELFPQLDGSLSRRRIYIRSFSSLHRQLAARAEEEASYLDRAPRHDDDRLDPLQVQDPLRGPVFGDMVHDVLESIDFEWIGQASDPVALLGDAHPFRKLLDDQLARNLVKMQTRLTGTALEEASRRQIAQLVWNTLHTPLSAAGGPLWQVSASDRIHEVEFHFPAGALDAEREALSVEHSALRAQRSTLGEEGFLTGFMDLVFRRQGRFFLVDWKTNLLDSYTPEALARAMEEADYLRQYRLYLQALARWLGNVRGGSFDFLRDFGGVYYLFLRGMNGRDESSGVFFYQPVAADLKLDLVLA
jgi:exodeoxyribonuclease V beta subunit